MLSNHKGLYIDNKKNAHIVLCAESDLQQCCNEFADEIQKQEDAYDVLCASNGEFLFNCLHNLDYKYYAKYLLHTI